MTQVFARYRNFAHHSPQDAAVLTEPSIEVNGLHHRYGDHQALNDLSLSVHAGEIFGLLGPNGSGKTTLFRILTTLLPVQEGTVAVLGTDVKQAPSTVRANIGVTFQSPSVDGKLTVTENLKHQAHLYGMFGHGMRSRISEQLERLGLSDRAGDRVDSLSGGLKRRVEVAKGLLHEPRVLLLDEPSTGLDPGARHDLWTYLEQLKKSAGMTILVTTHLMEEAERCDRLGILDRGQLVVAGTPDELCSSLGAECVTIQSPRAGELAAQIEERFEVEVLRIGDDLRVEQERGLEFVQQLMEAFPAEVSSVSLGKPTLEDVFISRTGHRFWDGELNSPSRQKRGD